MRHKSKRNTGHPAKDSGGGMNSDEWFYYHIEVARGAMEGRVGHRPIKPDDYARHWQLEGPR